MGILDDAIREHLDLKRKHGAREAEIREIEDEALGSGEQPDPFAAGNELFGEVSTTGTPEAGPAGSVSSAVEVGAPEVGGEEPTRLVQPEALRREPEAPALEEVAPGEPSTGEPPTAEPGIGSIDEPVGPPEDSSQIPGQTELPGQDEVPGQERLDRPLEDYRPSAEPEPPPLSESLEELIAEEEPFPEDSAAPPPDAGVEPGPSADRGGALEATELESHREAGPSVPDPPPPPPPGPEPAGRARGRVDVPTEEHPPPGETGGVPAVPPPEPEPTREREREPEAAAEPEPEPEPPASEGPALYDFETDDEPVVSSPPEEPRDDFEALGPADEEARYLDEEEPDAVEPASGTEPPLDEPGTEVRPALEDEEAYEGGALDPEEAYEEDDTDEGLWFEQGPPKDFDFD
jgi:hypothetical protein